MYIIDRFVVPATKKFMLKMQDHLIAENVYLLGQMHKEVQELVNQNLELSYELRMIKDERDALYNMVKDQLPAQK